MQIAACSRRVFDTYYTSLFCIPLCPFFNITYKNETLNLNLMITKSNWWNKLLKIVIVVASAVLCALGVQTMSA
ncbi:hypothetical protein BACSTE_00722 [Bacteroides stercoris ATCC 43183]|uniref:Uncharacterized protein n=1 Tax=Bacteroides stercoris ATCC 43183 TaxID=449673 RepID=B0NML3_BACSE|nr:hypothetical protein BACSTE_00722 [Bacteroides stercoris ATCC 43183]DAL08277.1 MAG TPA: hypothetical protein [Caudoviricetes sp.]